MASRSKRRYHHIQFDEDDEFQSPAFEFLNETKKSEKTENYSDSEDDIGLKDSEDGTSDDGAMKNPEDEDESDDAPEDVSFRAGKQTALQQMRDAIRNINAEKIKAKEKRRKIDEQYKEQKKRKLEELQKSRLSDEFLEDLTENYSSRKKIITTEQNNSKADSIERRSLQDDEDEGSFADTEDDFDNHEDFIPLETDRFGGIEVQPIKDYQKKTTSLALTAAEFKVRHLYGSKIRRESTKSKLAHIEKRKANR